MFSFKCLPEVAPARVANHESRRRSTGFTLVELMVVIAIIAVLAMIILPIASSAREKARRTACQGNLHAIALALRNYYTDTGFFPGPYDPIYGLGGVTQLVLSGQLTSSKVLRCPDDTTTVAQYLTENGIDPNSPAGQRWSDAKFFTERYSSYNQLFGMNGGPFPLYNYFGYRGHPGCTGSGYNAGFEPKPAGTGPSLEELGINKSTWTGVNYDDPQTQDYTNYTTLLGAGAAWAAEVHRDSDHPFCSSGSTGVVFDRNPSGSSSAYARPLWDASGTGVGTLTAYFPGLGNKHAPDETIITHCPYHRASLGNRDQPRDVVVRLGADTSIIDVNKYDWVVQKSE